MPQAEGGQELPYAGTPEMDALFQQINQNPQMLTVVGQNPELLAEVMKHAGLDTNAQQLIDMTSDWPDEAAEASVQASLPPSDEATAEAPAPDDDEAEVTDDEAEQPPDESVPVEDAEAATQEAAIPLTPDGSGAMPRGGSPIDDLISAQMMQSAVGNPNAPVPTGMQAGRQQRQAIPQSRQPSGDDGARKQMITELFRKQGAGSKNKKKANG